MTTGFVLDACALIAFFSDEEGADIVENLLIKAEKNEIALLIHAINALEIYYGILRDDNIETARGIMDRINKLPIKIIRAISDQVFYEAGRLKAAYSISLADAIAVAEANTRNAEIVTADHHELESLEKK